MPRNRDANLLETVRTHRARLISAFLLGDLAERRQVNDNVKRLLGSVVLAAVACAGCVGFSFITSILADQAAAKAEQEKRTAHVEPGVSDRPYAADYFDRTMTGGWGDSELGGAWQVAGDGRNYAVHDGSGMFLLNAGRQEAARLPDVLRDTADVTATAGVERLPVGGSAYLIVTGRRIADQEYRGLIEITPAGRVSIRLVGQQGGTTVPLSDTVSIRESVSGSPELKVRVNVYGTNPTRLRGKVWPADQDEPSDWQVQARDQTETMQRSGQVGIGAGLAKATRNGPFAVAVREFVARPVIG